MIQVPAHATIFVMHEAVHFRKGIDGLAAVARNVLEQEPMSGAFSCSETNVATCSGSCSMTGVGSGCAPDDYRRGHF